MFSDAVEKIKNIWWDLNPPLTQQPIVNVISKNYKCIDVIINEVIGCCRTKYKNVLEQYRAPLFFVSGHVTTCYDFTYNDISVQIPLLFI